MFAAVSLAGPEPEPSDLELDRKGETIVLEPYAPNIIRVTLSLKKEPALAAPGYGLIASPDAAGWSASQTEKSDEYKSSRMVVTVDREGPPGPPPLRTMVDIGKYFSGSTPGAHITLRTPEGKKLLEMTGLVAGGSESQGRHSSSWRATADPAIRSFTWWARHLLRPMTSTTTGWGRTRKDFSITAGMRWSAGKTTPSPAGPTTCVPFLVTNKGYGLVWDNPSKTTIEPGFNEQTRWTSEVGDRVSFFVIAGKTADEIYEGYRLLTGPTPMLPKAAYGYIQCKQRYASQAEVMAVANGYRERHLPADVIVVDWFYYTKMGQMDFDPQFWPDPAAMNEQLHKMGFQTMISVWPRFVPDDRFYAELLQKGWFIHLADGTPIDGLPYDRAGSDIDTTNPDAAKWYWKTIRDNIISKGFDSLWADETEPDLPPDGAYFHIGPGTQYFNVYPLLHTAALYNGFREDEPGRRALILSRDAYLGVQRNGTIVWSSDIYPTWDTFRRQIPTGLDFAASGITYWSNDTGGWQYLPREHHPAHTPLIDPSDARANVGGYDDYPELYTRWFQYATFLPIFRTHGSRRYNEVWSYGKQAEPILEKYLRLRYELMPYIYSLGYKTWKTGAPFLRALPLDFPDDPKVADLRDEYMLGPAFLVAPVTEQGATSRQSLSAGGRGLVQLLDQRARQGRPDHLGGCAHRHDSACSCAPGRSFRWAPRSRARSKSRRSQRFWSIRAPMRSFTLFSDDGMTYAYEKGAGQITRLAWDDAKHQLTHEGAAAWSGARQRNRTRDRPIKRNWESTEFRSRAALPFRASRTRVRGV